MNRNPLSVQKTVRWDFTAHWGSCFPVPPSSDVRRSASLWRRERIHSCTINTSHRHTMVTQIICSIWQKRERESYNCCFVDIVWPLFRFQFSVSEKNGRCQQSKRSQRIAFVERYAYVSLGLTGVCFIYILNFLLQPSQFNKCRTF